ncbi:unnamed protein product, partial [Adineta steineri]
MVQANGLVSLYSTNWYPLFHDWDFYYTVYMEPQYYGSCSCFTSSSCTQPAVPHMKGYLVGCTPIEALLRSSVACLYEQDCINTFTVYLNLPLPVPPPLNIIDSSGIQSTYSSALTIYSQVYSRPDSLPTALCYFQDIQMEVTTTGTYTIVSNSSMDAYGYIYNNSFNSSNPDQNLLAFDNDAGGNGQFMCKIVLQAGVHPMYFRDRNSSSTSLFYYEAVQISVSMTGIYTIVSTSNMDSKGYIYGNNFNASFPDENLLFVDDNMAGHEQFMLTVILDAMINYILIVTTYSKSVIGTFSIIGLGSDLIYFSPINVATTGIYTIFSNGTIKTCGYLYNDTLNPLFPDQNLLLWDDGVTKNVQFMLSIYLQAMTQYILVVTPYWPSRTGAFSINALGPGSMNLSTNISSTIKSQCSSALSIYSPMFIRAQSLGWSTPVYYFYQPIRINVTTTGLYTILSNSTMDTYGFLYSNTFDPSFPDQNLILYDNNGAPNYQFMLIVTLQAMKQYTLVVTTYSPGATGAFSIIEVGPQPIGFSIDMSSAIISQYSSDLSIYSLVFKRSQSPWPSSYFYYESIQINVATTGIYTIFSNSTMNTYGYLYNDTLNPLVPDQNLMLSDNDAAPNSQFMLVITLQAMEQYTLVVTTYGASTTGTFSIIGVGPASMNFSTATTGFYTIFSNSTMFTYGYLYNDTLNHSFPDQNLMVSNANSAPNSQFLLVITLEAMKQYTLVVTTYWAITTGTFSIITLGPASMNFSTDNSSTIKSQYSSALSIYSSVFNRSQSPWPSSYFYYESIQINVTTTGIYTIVSNSTMFTYGYLYNDTLNPSFPDQNLMVSNANSAPNSQFLLVIALEAMKQYTLVVTTYWASTTGTFSIITLGPASMNFFTDNSSTIKSQYSSALSIYSPVFNRSQSPWPSSYFYYESIQINVATTGFYTIFSNSTMNTYGYLYNDTLNPLVPDQNLMLSDNDAAPNSQ